MPLYEYKCQSCGKKFEVIQKFSDEALTTHPECGGPAEKLFSAPAFHLKGTGWYATDYAKTSSNSTKPEDGKSSEPAAAASSESKPAASETKSETRSDGKSETKSDTKPASPAPAT